MTEDGQKMETALVIGTFMEHTDRESCEEHLEELELLADTFGVATVMRFPCRVRKKNAATLISKGKLEELIDHKNETKADMVIFDDDLMPSQQRNLEKLLSCPVLDRTEVILEVFAQRAQTKEAKIQIALAKVEYEFPRLKRMWTHLERQRGGGLFLKGMGEKQIEVDRRLLQTKKERLEEQLREVRNHRAMQRTARQRSGTPILALIGYTNAGKSTLMNRLTDAGVLSEDKLFATLDTTTRHYTLPNNQEVLFIDTVGFIRKLPHQLVAAFMSTLEESLYADVLLHLIDVSHPSALEQGRASLEVLKQLGADDKPVITVLNKIDSVENRHSLVKWKSYFPKTVSISAQTGEGTDALIDAIQEELKKLRTTLKLCIPQKEYALITELTRTGNIHYQEYEGNDVILRADVPVAMEHRITPYIMECSCE